MRLTRDPKYPGNLQVEWRDHRGKLHRWTAFSDKKLSEAWGHKLERIVSHKLAGEPLPEELTRWILEQKPQTIRKLYELGLTSAEAPAPKRSTRLARHVEEYRRHMQTRELTPRHIHQVITHIEETIDAIGANYVEDISTAAVAEHLKKTRDAKKRSARWSNTRLAALKSWISWMKCGNLAGLTKLPESVDRRHDRVAFTVAELGQLYEAAIGGPGWRGVGGRERYLIYRMAAETGLRAGELRALLVEDFDLEADAPSVTIRAAFSRKSKRTDRIHLHKELAGELAAWIKGKDRKALAFRVPRETSRMIQDDLERAGLAFEAATAQYRDFHALRHSFCTHVGHTARSHADLQKLARHSSPILTARYAKPLVETMAQAIDDLPRPKIKKPRK